MADNGIFDLLTKMYSDMNSRFDKMDSRFDIIETDIKDLKRSQTIFEGKLEDTRKVLFDTYLSNKNQLDRIEAEVTKHDEIIFRRAK
jgi:hypothetical protein